MTGAEMREVVRGVVATCFQTVLRDEPWQDFGFRKRPTYGTLIQKLRPTWKIELEKRILKEMVIVLTAAHVVAGVLPRDDIEHVVNAYTSTPDLARSLGYSSRNEALVHLRESIGEYVLSSPDEWSVMLFTRMDPNSLPNKKTAARVVVGCAKFGMDAQNMVRILRQRST